MEFSGWVCLCCSVPSARRAGEVLLVSPFCIPHSEWPSDRQCRSVNWHSQWGLQMERGSFNLVCLWLRNTYLMVVLFTFLCIFLLTYSLKLNKYIWNIDYNLRKFTFIKYYILLWVDRVPFEQFLNAEATTFSWEKSHLLSIIRNREAMKSPTWWIFFIIITLTMQVFLGRDMVTCKAVEPGRDSY